MIFVPQVCWRFPWTLVLRVSCLFSHKIVKILLVLLRAVLFRHVHDLEPSLELYIICVRDEIASVDWELSYTLKKQWCILLLLLVLAAPLLVCAQKKVIWMRLDYHHISLCHYPVHNNQHGFCPRWQRMWHFLFSETPWLQSVTPYRKVTCQEWL